MKFFLLIILLNLLPSLAVADWNSEENSLLKSWGLQFNAQGRVKFRALNNAFTSYSPWKPDMSAYQSIASGQVEQEVLKPLVISAKQKAEK